MSATVLISIVLYAICGTLANEVVIKTGVRSGDLPHGASRIGSPMFFLCMFLLWPYGCYRGYRRMRRRTASQER